MVTSMKTLRGCAVASGPREAGSSGTSRSPRPHARRAIRMPIIGVIQSLDFTGLGLIHDINKSLGLRIPLIEEPIAKGHFGVSTSRLAWK